MKNPSVNRMHCTRNEIRNEISNEIRNETK